MNLSCGSWRVFTAGKTKRLAGMFEHGIMNFLSITSSQSAPVPETHRVQELPGQDSVIMAGEDVVTATRSHRVPLRGARGHQPEDGVSRGLGILRGNRDPAAAFGDHIITGLNCLDNRLPRHHV